MIERETPGPGQESVWDYPRPPRAEPETRTARVIFNGQEVARSDRAIRVLETSHPPTIYFPPDDVRTELLVPSEHRSHCEFKGAAVYWSLRVNEKTSPDAAWSYPHPTEHFRDLRDYIAFYPGRVDACYLGDEQVQSQEGDFYGGWITSDIAGPFKGSPGTRGW
ncbi:MAG: DUF427 domain-containing protein [Chloroflexota bacterium]